MYSVSRILEVCFIILLCYIKLNETIKIYGGSPTTDCSYPNRLEVFYMAGEPQSQAAVVAIGKLPPDILNSFSLVFLPCFDFWLDSTGAPYCKSQPGADNCKPDIYDACAIHYAPDIAFNYIYAAASNACTRETCLWYFFDWSTASRIEQCAKNGGTEGLQLCAINGRVPRDPNPNCGIYYPIIELNEKWIIDGKDGGPDPTKLLCMLCKKLIQCTYGNIDTQVPSCAQYMQNTSAPC